MEFDVGLPERVRDALWGSTDVVEKKMFRGLCFMVSENMCCGIIKGTLAGPGQVDDSLKLEHAPEMDFTGSAMKGMIYVSPEGVDSNADLDKWIGGCIAVVETLPVK